MTFAIVLGDSLGNLRIFAPAWIAYATTFCAVLAFLARERNLGSTLTLFGIVFAATIPVQQLLVPPADPATSLTRFADDSLVTVEGYLERAPERVGGERDRVHLYLRVERAGSALNDLQTVTGLVRITTTASPAFRVGDELRVTSRIRFPRNDGNPGEFDYRGWLLRQGITASMYAEPRKTNPHPISILGHRQLVVRSAIERSRAYQSSSTQILDILRTPRCARLLSATAAASWRSCDSSLL